MEAEPAAIVTRSRAAILVVVIVGVSILTALGLGLGRPTGRPGDSPAASPTTATSSGAAGGPVTLATVAFEDSMYDSTLNHEPTGGANQAKVWYAADRWWSTMIEPKSHELRIARLDSGLDRWVDTGVVVDDRLHVRAAVAWDGTRLAVATAGSKATESQAIRFATYHLDAASLRFVIDPDYPIPLSTVGVTSPTLGRDAMGILWLADVDGGRLVVRHTTGDDHRWSPDVAAHLAGADGTTRTASLIAGAGRILVAWNRANDPVLRLAEHRDGDADATWANATTEVGGLANAPGDLSVVAVGASPEPRVLIAFETATDTSAAGTPLAPGALVVVRAADGSWSTAQLGRRKDHLRAPVLAIDAARNLVLAIAATADGRIVVKPASVDRLDFESGDGQALIAPAQAGSVSAPSTAGGPVDLDSGIVVLAADDRAGHYVHGIIRVAPSDAASPSIGPSSRPDQAVPGAVLRVDSFDPWTVGTNPPTWVVSGESGGRGRAAIVAVPSNADRSLRLVSTSATGSVRSCTTFPPTATGVVTISSLVRLGRLGGSDATVASVRGPGGEAVSARVTRHGLLAYYRGALKITTVHGFRAGVWYRSTVVVHLATHTFDWTIAIPTGRSISTVRGIAWRDPAIPSVDTLCVQTPLGLGTSIVLDNVMVSR